MLPAPKANQIIRLEVESQDGPGALLRALFPNPDADPLVDLERVWLTPTVEGLEEVLVVRIEQSS